MPLIKQEILDQVIHNAGIVEVGQQLGLDLKKRGANFMCKSPFIDEKTASCSLSPTKNIFKDFSSGIGGGPVELVKRVKGVQFTDAVQFLADMQGVGLEYEEVSEEEQQKINTREELYQLMEAAKRAYVQALMELPKDHPAKVYVNERFTPDQQMEWQIGYAPAGFDFLKKTFIAHGILQGGIDAGLIKQKEGDKTFDFFRDRIMFPIMDTRGRVVSFGGRIHPGSEPMQNGTMPAKYLNGPDSLIYNKSQVLFGMNQALNSKVINKYGYVYVVEGYTDVIAMHGADISNTVASCGTALTSDHIKLIGRYANHLVSLRDNDDKPDNPGEKATIKDIELCLMQGMKVSVVRLPAGEDPDSWIKNQVEELKT